jgi:hypothetical protein
MWPTKINCFDAVDLHLTLPLPSRNFSRAPNFFSPPFVSCARDQEEPVALFKSRGILLRYQHVGSSADPFAQIIVV